VLYASEGRANEAIDALRRMVETNNESPAAYAEAVKTLRVLGDPAGAQSLLRHALALHPHSRELRALGGEAPLLPPPHPRPHPPSRLAHPHQPGAGDEEVADVQFLHAGEGGDGADVAGRQAVAGVEVEAAVAPPSRRPGDLGELGRPRRVVGPGVGVG